MYWIIDSYYDNKSDTLHLILKDKTTKKKKTVKITNPLYEFYISKFDKKIKYVEDTYKLTKVILEYNDYKLLAKYIKHLYLKEEAEAERTIKRIDEKKYEDYLKSEKLTNSEKEGINNAISLIKQLKKYPNLLIDIYDDIKIESLYHRKYEIIPFNELNIGIIDLEVYSPGNTSIEKLATEASTHLILATLYLSNQDKYYTFVLLSKLHQIEDKSLFLEETYNYIKQKEGKDQNIEIFLYNKEEELIADLLSYINKADVLLGWNSSRFDIRYLYNRCKQSKNLSPLFKRYLGEYFEGSNAISEEASFLTKIVHLDYIHLIKEFNKKANYVRYNLDYIAKQLLGKEAEEEIGKVKIKGINQEYFENLKNFIYYNFIDVKLVKMIDDVMNFVRILFTIKEYTGGFTTSYIAASNYLDVYVVKEANKNNKSVISSIKTVNYYSREIFKKYIIVNSLYGDNEPLRTFLSVLDTTIMKNVKKVKEKIRGIVNKLLNTNLEEDRKIQKYIDEILDEYKERIYPFITKESSYPGAYVKNPRPGVYKGVIDFDASVTGDHIIPVIRNGKYFEVKIEDYNHQDGDKTLAYNFITKQLEVCDIEEVFIHNWKDEIVEIKLENNEVITVTNNHSVYKVDEKNNVENVVAEKLKINDYIPVFKIKGGRWI